MNVTTRSTSRKVFRTVAAGALTAGIVVATATAGSATATVLTMTPSSATGSTSGGNTIVLTLTTTATTAASNKFASGAFTIQFQNVAASVVGDAGMRRYRDVEHDHSDEFLR